MPVVSLDPNRLFFLMGIEPLPVNEFKALLKKFGLELDAIVVEDNVTSYKIDIPANRADLLSVESIATNLKCFLGASYPKYKIMEPQTQITIDESVKSVRPFLVCAVLRNITFSPESVKSFIDFQDKLHHNLCRRRTLASIGTHDLDSIVGPLTYSADKPEDIVFVPLTGGEEVNGRQLYANLMQHQQLSKFLSLLDQYDRWPVIRDGKNRVMSLPPIINSDFSKITNDTKNVFIECTATDLTRALTAVVVLVAAFSIYCQEPFSIEQVKIINGSEESLSPKFDFTQFVVEPDYIRSVTGLATLTNDSIIDLLGKMQLEAHQETDGKLRVICPPTRTDILHPCDIAEDVAIAYGYDNIDKMCRKTISAGRALPINEYCDRLSKEMASSLYNQILTFSLCSKYENFDALCLPDDGSAATIQNAQTAGLEIVRTQLLSGLLQVTRKILKQPHVNPLPLRLFELSDVCLIDRTHENNVRNERRFCATICDTRSRFTDLHGLLDRFIDLNQAHQTVQLKPEDSPTCIPGQRASIIYKGQSIGWIGVIHPQVLLNFKLTKPVVAFELQIQPFI